MTGEFEEYNYDYVTGEFVRKVDGVLWNEIFANASVHSSNENRGGGRGSADVSAVTESKFSFRWRVNPSTGILEEYEPHQFLEGELIQNRNTGTLIPSVFLAVVAFLLNIVVSRILLSILSRIEMSSALIWPASSIKTISNLVIHNFLTGSFRILKHASSDVF